MLPPPLLRLIRVVGRVPCPQVLVPSLSRRRISEPQHSALWSILPHAGLCGTGGRFVFYLVSDVSGLDIL